MEKLEQNQKKDIQLFTKFLQTKIETAEGLNKTLQSIKDEICQNIVEKKNQKNTVAKKLLLINEKEMELYEELKTVRVHFLKNKNRHEKLVKSLGQ